MRKLTKITAIILSVVMMFSIAACGNKAADEPATEAETTTAAAVTETETEAVTEAPTEAETEAETQAEEVVAEAVLLHPQIVEHYQSAQREDNTFAYDMIWSEVQLPEDEAAQYPELARALEEFNKNEVAASDDERTNLVESAASVEESGWEEIPQLAGESKLNIVRADSNYFCIGTDFYGYYGGAHGGSMVYGDTFKTEDGTRVTLEDIITDEETFVATVKDKLLDEYDKEEFFDIDTDMAKYTLEAGIQDMNDEKRSFTWALGYDSVTVYFNQYDIAPYAAGIQIVELKFADYPELFKGSVQVAPENRISYIGWNYEDYYRYDSYAVKYNGNEYTYSIYQLDDEEKRLDVKSGDEVIGSIAGDVYKINEEEELSNAPEKYSCSQRKNIIFTPTDPEGFTLENFDKTITQYVITEYRVSDNGMPVEK